MASLDRIVNVVIALGTSSVDERSFREVLFLTENTNLTDRVTTITKPGDLLILGVLETDPLYRAAVDFFSQSPSSRMLFVAKRENGESVAEALTAAVAEAPVYTYGILLESREEADVKAAAEWAELEARLFVTATPDPDTVTSATSDIGAFLQDKGYFHTAVLYTGASDEEYPDAALISERFTYTPGTETWSGVELVGVAADPLTEGEYLYAKGKNVTTFERFRNYKLTQGGKVAAGEYIDVIRFRDYLVERIKVAGSSVIIRATNTKGKVPYTDGGIGLIIGAVQGVLEQAVNQGIAPEELDEFGNVVPSFTIERPLNAAIPTSDKEARILKNINFTARLEGAIHATEISGILTY